MSMPSDDILHCHGECGNTYVNLGLIDEGEECAHCECCCECLGCIYAPRDSVPLTEQQRAPITAYSPERTTP